MRIELLPSREDYQIAGLAALAVAIHVLESAVPSPVPGIKPGLSNIITLLVYLRFGWRWAAWVSLLRVIVGSLTLGTFLSPAFVLSGGGALASLLLLGGLSVMPGRLGLGAVGVSVLMALAHMLSQFLLAWALFVPHPGMWNLLPLLLTAALVFGLVNGRLTMSLQEKLCERTGT